MGAVGTREHHKTLKSSNPGAAARAGRDKKDDIIPPGSNWTFVWQVTERSGPGPADPSSIMWMYHSHFDEVADVNAGLMGAIIVSRHVRAAPSSCQGLAIGLRNSLSAAHVLSGSMRVRTKQPVMTDLSSVTVRQRAWRLMSVMGAAVLPVTPGLEPCHACAQGSAQPNGAPNDVDREFILSYTIEDEVKSFYFNQNLKQLGAALTNDQQTTLSADDDGAANEHFHAINGAAPTGFWSHNCSAGLPVCCQSTQRFACLEARFSLSCLQVCSSTCTHKQDAGSWHAFPCKQPSLGTQGCRVP